MALPALRAIARTFSNRLTLISSQESEKLFFSRLPLRGLIETAVWRCERGYEIDVDTTLKKIAECDLFLSLVPWHTSSLSKLVGGLRPTISVGFCSEFIINLPRDFSKHAADLKFDVARAIDPRLGFAKFSSPLPLDRQSRGIASSIRRIVTPDRRVLVVHPEASAGAKMWEEDKFVWVLDKFLECHPEFMVFVISEGQQNLEQGRQRNQVIPIVGVPLSVAFALVGVGDLFLGVDSCMLHVADSLRVPGVGLFGPTRPEEFGFRLGPHVHIDGKGSMQNISPSAALSALERLANGGTDGPDVKGHRPVSTRVYRTHVHP